ncbi:class I SAM-dependent methyltransferase [Pseudomonas putida]|uniref:class I SAM-dependent methyltransferase n=1 Tax=Pseudomonas putida TaxID=303 RepID=UPI002363C306|nr:class I SAM-dependent methyltransferase [Pseudomonas putida]MDD1965675.1 class I SAM-dependent methyltransferase [Pseudomonas putida]
MVRELYRATDLPVLQNRTFAEPHSARQSGRADLVLVQDEETGLIYNQAFDPAKLIYDSNYQNEQAHSALFKQHLEVVEGILARHFTGKVLVEVGCGKGYFLEMLAGRGYDIRGVDPAYEGDNPAVIKDTFNPRLGIRADGVVLRHVLEHIPDPMAFLAQIAAANHGGQIYIEVPCFDWILEHRAWFDLFYEHVNYFRLEDLRQMFGNVQESGYLFNGQFLYVVANLASLRRPVANATTAVSMPAAFDSSLNRAIEVIKAAPHKGVAVWGGASKGVIFSLFLQRMGIEVDYVVDINPQKQGQFLPLSGLRVSSPEEAMSSWPAGTHLFVMNSNYLEEIKRMTGGACVYHAVDDAVFHSQIEAANQ